MIIAFDLLFDRVEVPTEKRAKRWAISIEDLVTDQTGNYSNSLFIHGLPPSTALTTMYYVLNLFFFLFLLRSTTTTTIYLKGLQELTNYLRKEYSHENIRFWLATNQLRSGPASKILHRVQEIYQ
jgi:regulator of G-protein signaling